MVKIVPPKSDASNLTLKLVVGPLLGQGQQDHGELLFVDLAITIKVAAFEDGVLKILQVGRVVILFDQLQKVLEKAAQLFVFDGAVAILLKIGEG